MQTVEKNIQKENQKHILILTKKMSELFARLDKAKLITWVFT